MNPVKAFFALSAWVFCPLGAAVLFCLVWGTVITTVVAVWRMAL